MINLDDRIFDEVTKPEQMWLLLHIAKRMSKENSCFPKNYTIAKDCGWSINTVQKYKKELRELGLLEVRERFINNKQAGNNYIVKTDAVKIYVSIKSVSEKAAQNLGTQTVGTQNEGTQSMGTQDVGNRSINHIEVLTNTSINHKDIKAIKQDLTTPAPKNDYYDQFMQVMAYLSEKSGNKFRFGQKAKVLKSDKYKKVAARLKEYNLGDLKSVIDVKCKEWADSAEWCKYLVPKTLFAASNFEKYLDQVQNAGRTFEAQPLQPNQDDYQLDSKLEEKYQKSLMAYNQRAVSKRISYFTKQQYESWIQGEQFRIYRITMLDTVIYKKIASVVSGLDSMPIFRNATGELSDFVKQAFTGKIRELG